MAHLDLSGIETQDDVTEEILANDEEHKSHCKTRLLISQKIVEALRYKSELQRQLAITSLERGEICSIQNLVEFNKVQIELNAELQYQELLSMELLPRLQAMRKIANQLKNMHNHANNKQEKTVAPSEVQYKKVPKVTGAKVEEEGSSGIIPIQKKTNNGKTRTMNL